MLFHALPVLAAAEDLQEAHIQPVLPSENEGLLFLKPTSDLVVSGSEGRLTLLVPPILQVNLPD